MKDSPHGSLTLVLEPRSTPNTDASLVRTDCLESEIEPRDDGAARWTLYEWLVPIAADAVRRGRMRARNA